jgi:hypothetical protein
MEFGEMANWRPLDGTPGLKRQRAETLRDSGQRNAYATVNFEWTCQGLPEGFDNYSEIEQQVVNQIGYVTDNINMDFNRHYDTMEVEIDGVFYPCEFEYQLEFDEINYHGAENFNAYSDPISERQVWKIDQLGGKVSQNMNRSQASDYIKDLMGKPSGTWKKE